MSIKIKYPLEFEYDHSNERLLISDKAKDVVFSGRMGIATNPKVKFHIKDSGQPFASGPTLQVRIENPETDGRAILEVESDDAFFDMRAHGTSYEEANFIFGDKMTSSSAIMGRHGKLFIGTYEKYDFILGSANIERIRIKSADGKVCISELSGEGTRNIGADSNGNLVIYPIESGLEWLGIKTEDSSSTINIDFDDPKAHKIPLDVIEDDIEIIIKNLPENVSKTMTLEIIGHSTNNYDVTWKYGASNISAGDLAKIFQDGVHLYKVYSEHRYFITITTMGDDITDTIISFIRI